MTATGDDRRLTLVIHALGGGGAERVFCTLANHWAEAGWEVTAITLDAGNHDVFRLDPRIRRIGLDLMRHSRGLWQQGCNTLARVWRLRQAIRGAGGSRVVSFTDKMNVLTLLACRGGPYSVVIAERSDPRHQSLGTVWEWVRRRTYPWCAAWVVQTEARARSAGAGVANSPVAVIPNSVAAPAGPVLPLDQRQTRIVGMGRLNREKGFDLLIRAFAHISPWYPDWTLQIFGDGPQRAELEHLADSLGVRDRVQLAGWTDQPETALLGAGAFVLASRYEGFPNALLEAMACGLPCVATACDSGPTEIIRDGVDGVLVPPEDVDALAEALRLLVSDDARRTRLGRRATEVTSRFSREAFFARWDTVVGLRPAEPGATLGGSY